MDIEKRVFVIYMHRGLGASDALNGTQVASTRATLVVNKDAINKTLFGETRAPSALLYNPPHAFLALRHSHPQARSLACSLTRSPTLLSNNP